MCVCMYERERERDRQTDRHGRRVRMGGRQGRVSGWRKGQDGGDFILPEVGTEEGLLFSSSLFLLSFQAAP